MRNLIPALAVGLLAALSLAGVSTSAVAQPSAELAAQARRGQEAMSTGRFEEAARIYGELVQAVPGEAGLRLNLGMALAMAGRPREARPHLQAAVDSGRPELVPAALFLGGVHLELGEPDRAVGPLETFLAAQPGNRDARRMLAETLLLLERYGDAVPHYRTLTEQAPEDPGAWFGLGRSYEGVAQRAFEGLQVTGPESAEILLLVGGMMVAQERDKRAFQLYREALEKQPGLAEAHQALAGIYEREGHPDWAGAERAKARALPAPDCEAARLECDFAAGRYAAVVEAARLLQTAEGLYWLSRAAGELARDAFSRLEALGPSPEATLAEVQVLRAQRRYAESKEALQEAAEAWPEDPRLRQELAKLLFIGREYEAARPLLEELLRQQPDSPEAHLLLGELWVEQRKPEEAISHLEKAAVAGPLELRARAALGRAYLDAGQAEKAVPHLEAALATDEDGALRFQLARAYQATGQADRARQMREEFQEIQRAQDRAQEEEIALTPP